MKNKPFSRFAGEKVYFSPWLAHWIIENTERETHKIIQAIEKIGDGNYGFLQDELLYCAHELMELHGFVTYLQVTTHTE